MAQWTNDPELRRLENLRLPQVHEHGSHLSGQREEQRNRTATSPEARLGMKVADEAMRGMTPRNDGWVGRIVPAAIHSNRIPQPRSQPSLAGRFSGDRGRREKAEALDDRCTAIAQLAAEDARRWIGGGDAGTGTGSLVEREVRRRTVDRLAAPGTPFDESKLLARQLAEASAPDMRRVTTFLSMGADVETAIDRSAARQAGADGGACKIADAMRRTMAAARIGVVKPERIVELATSPAFAELDTLPPGKRHVAIPTFGRKHRSDADREAAITAATSSPTRPVPDRWRLDPGRTQSMQASPSRAAVIAMQTGRGIT